jgi:hypothetical protein
MQLKMRKAQLEAAEKATARVAPVPDCVTTWNADKVAQFLSRMFHARSEEYGVMQRLEIDDKQLKFMVERMEPQEIEQALAALDAGVVSFARRIFYKQLVDLFKTCIPALDAEMWAVGYEHQSV